jgi:hypothetical protein
MRRGVEGVAWTLLLWSALGLAACRTVADPQEPGASHPANEQAEEGVIPDRRAPLLVSSEPATAAESRPSGRASHGASMPGAGSGGDER